MRLLVIISIIAITGCSTVCQKLTCPSESLYYQANSFYENKNYEKAIDTYKKFLDKNPSLNMATSAKLNLGMSYYYAGDFAESLNTLKSVSITDGNLRQYVAGIINECAQKMPKAGETAKAPASLQEITIEIDNAYLDDFETLVMEGKTSAQCDVYANNAKAQSLENNKFSARVNSWKKGEPVILVAQSPDGQGKKDYFPDSEAPEKPENLRVINTGPNSVEFEWDQNREPDIKGYKVYYQLKGGSPQEIPQIITGTKHEVVGLRGLSQGADKTFQFYLRAVDKMNNYSNPSDLLEATLP